MKKDYSLLLKSSKEKTLAAITLVQASLNGLEKFEAKRNYSPKELERYDALGGRFIRAIETSIKFFKTYEYYVNTNSSETFRDLLLNMEKLKLISSLNIWIDMRDIRNRIVHDYLPDQVKNIYDLIMSVYKDELANLRKKIEGISLPV